MGARGGSSRGRDNDVIRRGRSREDSWKEHPMEVTEHHGDNGASDGLRFLEEVYRMR